MRRSAIPDSTGPELGSIDGMIYPSGGENIAECLAFCRLAGQNMASR
jgi:hypothetical protein